MPDWVRVYLSIINQSSSDRAFMPMHEAHSIKFPDGDACGWRSAGNLVEFPYALVRDVE